MEYNSESNRSSGFKSAERVRRGLFKMTRTITPELYDTKSSQLIVISITKSKPENLGAHRGYIFNHQFCKQWRNSYKKIRTHFRAVVRRARSAVFRLQLSSYKKFKLDSCYWTSTWLRSNYVSNKRGEPITITKHFVIDTIKAIILLFIIPSTRMRFCMEKNHTF